MSVGTVAAESSITKNDRPGADRTRFRVNADVVAQQMGGDFVLVHLRTNQICELTDASARTWELLASGLDKASVVAALEREFDVDPSRVRAELDSFISALTEFALIEEHDGH